MTAHSSDVVVIGSGAAAMSTALRASIGGAKVTVLEVSDLFGGTSATSGGGMWLPNNHRSREAGVVDSAEAVKTYLMRLTGGVTDEAVVDRYVECAPKVLAFIEENTALTFYADVERPDVKALLPGAANFGRLVAPNPYDLKRLGELRPKLRQPDWERRTSGIKGGGGMEAVTQQEMQGFAESDNPDGWIELSRKRVAEGIVPRGAALIGAMLEVVAQHGATLLTNARARELVVEDGRVVGVIAEVDGELQTFLATSGVMLAAGGFEWNAGLWRGLIRVPGVEPLSPKGYNRGDALLMAEKVGARLALLDQVWWSVSAGEQPGQIAVNQSGHRFCNECLGYDFGKALQTFDPHTYTFPNLPAYAISNRPLALADSDMDNLGNQVAHVFAAEAPTLRELAEKLDIDADNLEATVAEFDKHAAEGKDPQFGRGESPWDLWRKLDTSLANPALAPVGTTGPFYAQRIVPRCFGTKGGAVIDDRGRIIDFEGNPIPGLFGAGNSVASPVALAYPGGGGSLGPGVTFGYVAGETLTI
jgi:3-oxosteroid 1-dehydrogenase